MTDNIVIIGCGPGSPELLTQAAVDAANSAEVIVGAERLLDLFPESEAIKIRLESDISQTLDAIKNDYKEKKVAVLVTGDPGLFSLAKLVIRKFGKENCRVIPGVSSVQAAFAAIGETWHDAKIISAHHLEPNYQELDQFDKLAILGGKPTFLTEFAQKFPVSRRKDIFYICTDISLPEQQLIQVAYDDLNKIQYKSRTIVLVIRSALQESYVK